jgi:ketosteroid isomerase-like protein
VAARVGQDGEMNHAQRLADRFMAALTYVEFTRKPDALASLFSDQCELTSIAFDQPITGAPIGKFWTDYVDLFETIKTEFTHTHATGDLAVLEWRSVGKLKDGGHDLTYRGVTILEFKGDKIQRFRTYYDSAAFLPDGPKRLGRKVG